MSCDFEIRGDLQNAIRYAPVLAVIIEEAPGGMCLRKVRLPRMKEILPGAVACEQRLYIADAFELSQVSRGAIILLRYLCAAREPADDLLGSARAPSNRLVSTPWSVANG